MMTQTVSWKFVFERRRFRHERSKRAESPTENHKNTPTAATKTNLRNLTNHKQAITQGCRKLENRVG